MNKVVEVLKIIFNGTVYRDDIAKVREAAVEAGFRGASGTCGGEYLGYVHICGSNRGVPGTGLVPWEEFFKTLKEIGYQGPLVIESFDTGFTELNRLCAVRRK